VNPLEVNAFAKKEFHDKSLLWFFHLMKQRSLDIMSVMIVAFSVLCGILSKIA
jgi:hypothetical protein